MKRYGSGIEYVMRMPASRGIGLIADAIRGVTEDRLYEWWIALVPRMDSKTFIPFSEFRDQMTGANIDKRTDEEILAEFHEIEERMKQYGN